MLTIDFFFLRQCSTRISVSGENFFASTTYIERELVEGEIGKFSERRRVLREASCATVMPGVRLFKSRTRCW